MLFLILFDKFNGYLLNNSSADVYYDNFLYSGVAISNEDHPYLHVDRSNIYSKKAPKTFINTNKLFDPYHIAVSVDNNPFINETLNLIVDEPKKFLLNVYENQLGVIDTKSSIYDPKNSEVEIIKGYNIKTDLNKLKQGSNANIPEEVYLHNIEKQKRLIEAKTFSELYDSDPEKHDELIEKQQKIMAKNEKFLIENPMSRDIDEDGLNKSLKELGEKPKEEKASKPLETEFSKQLKMFKDKKSKQNLDNNSQPILESKIDEKKTNLTDIWNFKVQNAKSKYYYALKINHRFYCPSTKNEDIIVCDLKKNQQADIFVWDIEKSSGKASLKHHKTGECIQVVKHENVKNKESEFYKVKMGECKNSFKIELASVYDGNNELKYNENVLEEYKKDKGLSLSQLQRVDDVMKFF